MGLLEPLSIFVDGYNVIRAMPGLAAAEAKSLQSGREALLAQVIARYRHTPHRVVVVFDGAQAVESVQPIRGLSRGQVVFTQADETADAAIHRLVERERACGAECVVVSDDLEVRLTSAAQSAQTARVDDLARRLNEPPKTLQRLARHRAYIRQQWERDPDAEEPASREGNPHRAPRKRRRDRRDEPDL